MDDQYTRSQMILLYVFKAPQSDEKNKKLQIFKTKAFIQIWFQMSTVNIGAFIKHFIANEEGNTDSI